MGRSTGDGLAAESTRLSGGTGFDPIWGEGRSPATDSTACRIAPSVRRWPGSRCSRDGRRGPAPPTAARPGVAALSHGRPASRRGGRRKSPSWGALAGWSPGGVIHAVGSGRPRPGGARARSGHPRCRSAPGRQARRRRTGRGDRLGGRLALSPLPGSLRAGAKEQRAWQAPAGGLEAPVPAAKAGSAVTVGRRHIPSPPSLSRLWPLDGRIGGLASSAQGRLRGYDRGSSRPLGRHPWRSDADARISKAGCVDVTCSPVCDMSTGQLHERTLRTLHRRQGRLTGPVYLGLAAVAVTASGQRSSD
jgi:hypothetical protein